MTGHLSLLDAMFLDLERADEGATMHFGAVMELDPLPEGGAPDVDWVRANHGRAAGPATDPAGGCPRDPSRPRRAHGGPDRPLVQLRLDAHQFCRLLECANGLAERVRLTVHRGAALLEQVEDRVERSERALDQALQQLDLPLDRGEQRVRDAGPACPLIA
jgi:hypothetical protein